MIRLKKENKIYHSKMGNIPLLKRYLDEMPGIMLQDVWDDVKSVQVTKKESVGYPTQKPEKLLHRIIEISSNEKDIVLDPFCGSGTTLVAAKELNRKFIGIDTNQNACSITRKRLRRRKTISISKKTEPTILAR